MQNAMRKSGVAELSDEWDVATMSEADNGTDSHRGRSQLATELWTIADSRRSSPQRVPKPMYRAD
jgi:hypothetical protein